MNKNVKMKENDTTAATAAAAAPCGTNADQRAAEKKYPHICAQLTKGEGQLNKMHKSSED